MFSISTKTLYGLAALFELAAAHGKRCMQIKEIARAQRIPENYLRQLLLILKKAKLVESVRGSHGGYRLIRPPAEISVGKILETLGGPVRFTSEDLTDKTLSEYLRGQEQEMMKLFDRSLEDLVLEKQRTENKFTYHI